MEAEEGPESKRAGTLDPVAQKKHAAMLDRLANLHQSRLQQSAARSSAVDAAVSPAFESVAAFLDRFADSRHSIEADLQRCRALAAAGDSAGLKPELEKVAAAISDVDRLVAENSYFLPSYEVRSALKAIAGLKEALEAANAELLPRKKFSFRNKATKKDPCLLVKEIEETTKVLVPEKSDLSAVRESPGFRNREGSVLIKHFRVAEEGDSDFTLSDLKGCQIYLKGSLRALFIHRLTNCRVYAGPVLGSILIEEVSDCLLMLASHQIRIHHARRTDFYLRIRSRPIIEDSSGVRFAPYRLHYQGIEEELEQCGLGEETGNYAKVDDFKWLRAVQSPNWNLIPEEELVDTIDVSEIS